MNSYRIGTLAEKIVAVKINLDGTVTPFVRHRLANGWMADDADQPHLKARQVTQTDFVARVTAGDSGVITITMVDWRCKYRLAAIPLGAGDPFQRGELGGPGEGEGAVSGVNELWFRYADRTLTWRSGNVSGRLELSEEYPELAIVLRLPAGNGGEVAFETPLFPRADGLTSSVLAVAGES